MVFVVTECFLKNNIISYSYAFIVSILLLKWLCPRSHEALGSNPSTAKKKKKRQVWKTRTKKEQMKKFKNKKKRTTKRYHEK
jgi:hypothetical protein